MQDDVCSEAWLQAVLVAQRTRRARAMEGRSGCNICSIDDESSWWCTSFQATLPGSSVISSAFVDFETGRREDRHSGFPVS